VILDYEHEVAGQVLVVLATCDERGSIVGAVDVANVSDLTWG